MQSIPYIYFGSDVNNPPLSSHMSQNMTPAKRFPHRGLLLLLLLCITLYILQAGASGGIS